MSKIDKKIMTWEDAGLISKNQAEQIISFENNAKQPRLVLALLFLGIFIICSGIVSLIAANWDEISGWLKLIINFAVLAAISGGTYNAYSQGKKGWFEAGLFAIFLMVGASIALVAQVFQLHSNIANGFLSWAIFTTPLILLSKKKLLSLFFVPILLFSFLAKIEIWHILSRIFDYFEFLKYSPATVTGFLIIFFGLATFALKHADDYFRNQQPIMVVSKAYMVFFMYVSAISGFIYALFIMDYYIAYSSFKTMNNSIIDVIYMPTFFVLLAFLSTMVWISHKQNLTKQLNTNIILIGLAFFAVYVRLFGNLITTGFGLIISGIVILGIGWLVNYSIKKSKILKGTK